VQQIEHFIVLMLENRSFDHMLGYLDHPDPEFDGVGRLADPPTTPDARYAIYPGPDHSHRGVLQQILGHRNPPSYPDDRFDVTMSGFADNYELLAPGRGHKVMRCFDPQMVPVLSTLALEYAVCDRWFCSLPGETFPNRDFAHAGTSFGRVDVHTWPEYRNPPTIFSLLDAGDRCFRVYHQGVAHSLIYYATMFAGGRRRGSHEQLVEDIANDELPDYAFIEPDYGLPGVGNSQHPSQARSREEFVNGEALIARIYNALLANPSVFERTAFVITYDEHGGFYDHVPVAYVGMPDANLAHIYRDGTYRFAFKISGPRVPAVVVSPWIPRGTVNHRVRDHSCINETIRKRFLPNVGYPLNDRAEGTDLGELFSLDLPRDDYPEVAPLTHAEARALEEQLAAPPDNSDLDPRLDHSLQTGLQDLRNYLWSIGHRIF
jgi:phospholipase C